MSRRTQLATPSRTLLALALSWLMLAGAAQAADDAAQPLPEDGAPPAPAAPAAPKTSTGAITVVSPKTPEALKSQLVAARKQALAAREDLESASAAYARAQYEGLPAPKQSALSADQQRAQQAYEEALAEIGPLVEQAHRVGLDPKVIELYEAGLTKPEQ